MNIGGKKVEEQNKKQETIMDTANTKDTIKPTKKNYKLRMILVILFLIIFRIQKIKKKQCIR